MSNEFEPSLDLSLFPGTNVVALVSLVDVLCLVALWRLGLPIPLAISGAVIYAFWRGAYWSRRLGRRLYWSGSGALMMRRGFSEQVVTLRKGRLVGHHSAILEITDALGRNHAFLIAGSHNRAAVRHLRQRLVAGRWRSLEQSPMAPVEDPSRQD